MNIKVIIDNGVVRGVLKDFDIPIHVELIDTSDCYEDYEELEKYAQSVFKDPSYQNCEYSVANMMAID